MKDHELRELIGQVTTVARTYVGTQQLWEQIAHLIVPAFEKLKCTNAYLTGFQLGAEKRIESLNFQLDFEAKQRTELRKELAIALCQDGPDFADGHDCEGFVGGCERMGCPGGSECTELPRNKIIRPIQELFSDALQSDLEHGVKCLNENASKEFHEKYPELTKALQRLSDFNG